MKRKNNTPEADIQKEIFKLLRALGIVCWRNNSVGVFDARRGIFRRNNSPYSINGVSDILGIVRGQFLAIEVKSKTGKLTKEQAHFLDTINAEGGLAFVARSVNDVLTQFESLNRFTKYTKTTKEKRNG